MSENILNNKIIYNTKKDLLIFYSLLFLCLIIYLAITQLSGGWFSRTNMQLFYVILDYSAFIILFFFCFLLFLFIFEQKKSSFFSKEKRKNTITITLLILAILFLFFPSFGVMFIFLNKVLQSLTEHINVLDSGFFNYNKNLKFFLLIVSSISIIILILYKTFLTIFLLKNNDLEIKYLFQKKHFLILTIIIGIIGLISMLLIIYPNWFGF